MEWEAVEQLLLKGLIHHPVRRDWETTLAQVRADREHLKTWLVSRKATQTTMVHNLYVPPTTPEIGAITGKIGYTTDKDLTARDSAGAPTSNRRVRALVAYLQRTRRALYLSHLKLALGQASANEKTILRVPDEDSRAFEMLSLESLISSCETLSRDSLRNFSKKSCASFVSSLPTFNLICSFALLYYNSIVTRKCLIFSCRRIILLRHR